MMEEYVTFEQAKALKELGFNYGVLHGYSKSGRLFENSIFEEDRCYDVDVFVLTTNHNYYKDGISAPTQAQAQRWLREVKYINLLVDIAYTEAFDDDALYYWRTCDHMGWKLESSKDDDVYFDTYEQALSAGIDRVLDNLKEKGK